MAPPSYLGGRSVFSDISNIGPRWEVQVGEFDCGASGDRGHKGCGLLCSLLQIKIKYDLCFIYMVLV
ncbi:unnamed protein product [Musa hybrid cultivar]